VKRARKIARLGALYAIEAIALLVVGGAIAAGLLFWRLSQGPISLDFMRDELEEALAEALNGDVVSIRDVQASWRQGERSVGVELSDVVVAGQGGEILARAPRLAADLSFAELVRGDVAFSRIVAEGGEASVVRTVSGEIGVGLGGPERVAARMELRQPGSPRGAALLRDALEAERSIAGGLRELRLEGATLYVRDMVTGVDWRSDDATLRVTRDGSGVRAEAGGTIGTGAEAAELHLSARAGPGMRRALIEFELANATPSRLFPAEGVLAPLAGIDLPMNASASGAVDETQGLLAADLEVAFGAGRVRVLDRDVTVESARVRFAFDSLSDVLTLEDGLVASDLFAGRLRGRLEGAAEWLLGGRDGPYSVRFVGEALRADMRPVFADILEAESIEIEGLLHPAERRIDLDLLRARARNVEGEFRGSAQLERVSDGRLLPSVRLAGPVAGEAVLEDVLAYWPAQLADGAREWVAGSVKSGRASNVRLDLDLSAEALVIQRLEDERLTLSFDFDDTEVAFISTMSPLTGARGAGVLRGNSFTATLEAGEMAGLIYDSGFVDIPRLNPKGALARFGGVVSGTAAEVLAFLDQPPLGFPSSYGVAPSSIGGRGRVDFEITRPMLVDVPPDDIGFAAEGDFEGVSAPTMFPGLRVSEAELRVTANPDGVLARSEGLLGPAPAVIVWRENFADNVALSTQFHIESTLDAAAFDAFGAPVRRVFTGSSKLVMDSEGRGLDIARATIEVDLENAALELPDASWSKAAGEPGTARLTFARGEDGGFSLSDASLTAPGADIAGAVTLAGDGRLVSLDLDTLRIEDLVDARVTVARGEDGGLVVEASGAYADVSTIVESLASGGGGGVGAPLLLDARFARATARAGMTLEDVALEFDHDGTRTRRLAFSATGESGPISAHVEPAEQPGGPRRFSLEAADAGETLYMIFGVRSVRGGALNARADLPALEAPEDAPTSAVVEARGFTLAGAPPLAQILTIGSLEGLANTLAGEGIRFARLDAPMTIVDGRITLDEAQVAGQALGVTVSGVIDLEGRSFDLEGVLVPAYGVNSVLGGIPVIGDIFVSRRGEGVFGLTYTIDGPFEQSRVFVNPLSALAPGFLRRLFEPVVGGGDNPARGSGG
jgi:hypothetical protein